MLMNHLRKRPFHREWNFKTSRSSGAGGQHVNKVNTRVELYFPVTGSNLLSDDEKQALQRYAPNKISNDGYLQLASEQSRSQLKNREDVINKFYNLLEKAFQRRKKRIPTAPSKAVKEKRLEMKKQQSQKKQLRKYRHRP